MSSWPTDEQGKHAAIAAERLVRKLVPPQQCAMSVLNAQAVVDGDAEPFVVIVARGNEACALVDFVNRHGAPRSTSVEKVMRRRP